MQRKSTHHICDCVICFPLHAIKRFHEFHRLRVPGVPVEEENTKEVRSADAKIQPLADNRQPHLLVVLPVSTNEAPTFPFSFFHIFLTF